MVTMKRVLIVLVLLGSTALGGYRVFAGSGPEATADAAPVVCTPQQCQQKCGPCPQECSPTACASKGCTPAACPMKG